MIDLRTSRLWQVIWCIGIGTCLCCAACNKEPTSSPSPRSQPTPSPQPSSVPAAQKPSAGGKIEGPIQLSKKVQYPVKMSAGFVGKDGKGQPISPGTGFTIEQVQDEASQWVTCETWKPLLATLNFDPQKGWSYKHEGLPAGTYLVYAQWGDHYFDVKWVTVKDASATVNVPLAIDPDLAGKLEIELPMSKGQTLVAYIPLDEEGKIPLSDVQIQNFYEGKVVAKEPKVALDNIRAGKYRILAFPSGSTPVSADIEVTAGKTTAVELKESK